MSRRRSIDPEPPPGWKRKRFRLPIAAVLTGGFGGLMLLAVASVLILGLNTSGRNTFQLLSDKAELIVGGLEARVRAQLEPARAQAEFLARQIEQGEVDPGDRVRMSDLLRGSLAPVPQITGVAFLDTRGVWFTATRKAPGRLDIGAFPDPVGAADDLQAARETGAAVWVDPEWVEDFKTSVLSVRAPVRRDGRFLGAVVTGVSFQDLSRFLADIASGQDGTAFILYDERYVIAHPAMTELKASFADAAAKGLPPLPTLADLGDPVAAAIWQEVDAAGVATGEGDVARGTRVETRINPRMRSIDIEFREAEVGGVDYVYLLRRVTDYGARPWTLVVAFPEENVVQEIERLVRTAGLGFIILVISVVLSLLLGRAIARQIARLARAAAALRELDFRSVPELPDSRFREISNAAQAFNTMVAGLRWFETYVPKALVLRLIRRDGQAAVDGVISEEREVTVMFTDIKGFSTIAETMSPAQTAAMLNAHFSRLAACIEAEGGTVDKYIGDAIMAFWGAPDAQPDHAARALRAARAIVETVQEEARELAAAGLPPVCLRIGVHSGPVVVGNIGAASRINYTIVGDTVNTAARLEALGNELMGDSCAVVLASDDTVRAACAVDVPMAEVGQFSLRGRAGLVRVWRLLADYAVAMPGGASPAGTGTAAPGAGTAVDTVKESAD